MLIVALEKDQNHFSSNFQIKDHSQDKVKDPYIELPELTEFSYNFIFNPIYMLTCQEYVNNKLFV